MCCALDEMLPIHSLLAASSPTCSIHSILKSLRSLEDILECRGKCKCPTETFLSQLSPKIVALGLETGDEWASELSKAERESRHSAHTTNDPATGQIQDTMII